MSKKDIWLYIIFLGVVGTMIEKILTGKVYYAPITLLGISGILLILAVPFYFRRKKEKKLKEEYDVLRIEPQTTFTVGKPTPIILSVRNITGKHGMRIRIKSRDHVSPSSIAIQVGPNETATENFVVVPLMPGSRKIMFQFLPLYDTEGNLIPEGAATPIGVQQFNYDARPPLIAGLTRSQIDFLRSVVKVGTLAIVLMTVTATYMTDIVFSTEMSLLIPSLILLQIPVLYMLFYFRNKLPRTRVTLLERIVQETEEREESEKEISS